VYSLEGDSTKRGGIQGTDVSVMSLDSSSSPLDREKTADAAMISLLGWEQLTDVSSCVAERRDPPGVMDWSATELVPVDYW
jgi:hypothetical protein